ncbi:hypothetical protein TNCV_655211 [Trichonephila clavipes]|nr:hypothetical protein TNCV_655211 [Trichonephila clavipes]
MVSSYLCTAAMTQVTPNPHVRVGFLNYFVRIVKPIGKDIQQIKTELYLENKTQENSKKNLQLLKKMEIIIAWKVSAAGFVNSACYHVFNVKDARHTGTFVIENIHKIKEMIKLTSMLAVVESPRV